ncbi:MAG TPA: LamG-like jellyroll fold domain-containing protein, partial [Candidatus Acidoferrales bacterium]|nr:LamG-like jellyroll fold domain-containing protein [Candidatus Acidoferrales bacterium]
MKIKLPLALVTVLCLAAMGVHAQTAYSNAVMSLNPAGYWPMHEVGPAAPGDIETNYGTLGSLGTGYYPDWATTPAVALKRQHAGPFTVAGNTDVSVNFTHNLITGSTEQFTNMLFIPHASPLTTLNPPFSVECWFYPTNLSTGVDIWSQCGDEGLNAGAEGGTIGYIRGMRLVWVNSGFVIYAMTNQYDTGSANNNRLVFQEAPTGSNQWYHLVVTCDANTNVALFTNGVQAVTTVAAVSRYAPDYWTPLTVGGGYGATRSIAGYISEFAVYTNALSAAAVATHYSDGINVGASQYYSDVIESNPAVYLRMNSPTYSPPAFASLPVLNNLGTTNGVAVGNGVYSAGTVPGVLSGPANTNGAAFAGVTNSSPLLGGVSSYADAGFAAVYNPTGSNANFTITAMIRGYPGDGRIQSIVGHGTNSWVLTVSTNGCIVFNAGNGNNKTTEGSGQASGDISTTGVYNDGNWHQVVVVNQTNLVSIFVDAGLDTNGTPSGIAATNIIPGNASDVLIGSDPSYTNTPSGVGRNLAGQVCEVAFFTNALTATQIATLYGNSGVIVAPSVIAQPVNEVVNGGGGSSVQFGVGVKGTPALAYQWYFNSTSNYTGATQMTDNANHYANSRTALLTVTNLTQNDSGYYFVIITNQYGSTTSVLASLSVNTSPTIVSQFPLTYTNLFALYAGASPTFNVNVAGTSPFSYQWFTNGVLDGAAVTNTLQTPNVQTSFTNYCIVANVSGSVTSYWAALVLPDPSAPYPQQVLALNPVGYWRMNDTNLDGADYPVGPGNGDFGWICHDYVGGNDGIYTNCQLGFPGYDPLSEPSDSSAQFGEIDDLGSDFGDSLAFGIEGVNFGTPAGTSGTFSVEAWVSGYIQTTAGAGIVTLGYGGGGEEFC